MKNRFERRRQASLERKANKQQGRRQIRFGTRIGAEDQKRQELRRALEDRRPVELKDGIGIVYVTERALSAVLAGVFELALPDCLERQVHPDIAAQRILTATIQGLFENARTLYAEQLRFYSISQAELFMPQLSEDVKEFALHFAHDNGGIFIDLEPWFAYN